MLFLLAFLVLAIGIFAFLSGFELRRSEGREIRERLLAADAAARREGGEQAALLRDEMLSSIPALNRLLAQSNWIHRLQKYISQAGMEIRAGKLVLICTISGVAPALLLNKLNIGTLIPLISMAAGCALPLIVVAVKRGRRFKAFEKSFPDAIDLLARAVRAGHAFSGCLELIATEMSDPVAGEFQRVYDEQKFGLPMRDALMNLVDRVPLQDVRIFIASLNLQRETGGNLGELMDKLSYITRERFKILRQVRVYTAQGRLSMAILMIFPFALAGVLTFLNPNFLRPLWVDPLGHTFIGAGFGMLALGFLVLQKIIHIKV